MLSHEKNNGKIVSLFPVLVTVLCIGFAEHKAEPVAGISTVSLNREVEGTLSGDEDGAAVDERISHCVDEGIAWLVRHQQPRGYWSCGGFNKCCTSVACCDGAGRDLNDVGVTGLALLALLYSGSGMTDSPCGSAVQRGIEYLCDVQDPADGCLAAKVGTHWIYNHGAACLALVEAYRLSHDKSLVDPIRRAVDLIHHLKNPGKGWRYCRFEENPEDHNDMSVTGWMVQCMAMSYCCGITDYEEDIDEAVQYIDLMTDMTTGRTGYKEKGSYSSREADNVESWPWGETETLTAEAISCRYIAGYILKRIETQKEIIGKSARLLLKKKPAWDEARGCIDYCYYFFGTKALRAIEGESWPQWKESVCLALCDHQEKDGCTKGSWGPQHDPWGEHGGRVYATALCTMTLSLCVSKNKSAARMGLHEMIEWPPEYKVFYVDDGEGVNEIHEWGCHRIRVKVPRKITVKDAIKDECLPCWDCCRNLYRCTRKKESSEGESRILWPPGNKVFFTNYDEEEPEFYHNPRHKPRCPSLNAKANYRKRLTVEKARKLGIKPCPNCCADQYEREE